MSAPAFLQVLTQGASPKRQPLVGQRFHHLIILETTLQRLNERSARLVRAMCDCGRPWEGRANNVVSGRTTSCGCVRAAPQWIDRVGQRFGLLVIEMMLPHQGIGRSARVRAMCDCGRPWEGSVNHLVSGDASSCGAAYHRRRRTPQVIREQRRLARHRRAARQRGLPRTMTNADIDFLFHWWHFTCAICAREEGSFLHYIALDHWIPVTSPLCPGSVPGNMLPLCHTKQGARRLGATTCCNIAKHANDPLVWLKARLGPRKARAKLQQIERFFGEARQFAAKRGPEVLP